MLKRFSCFTLAAIVIMLFGFVYGKCAYAESNGIFSYRLEGEIAVISGIDGSAGGEIVLPSTLDGHTVAGIDDWAFSDNKLINAIVIPKTVNRIGDGAFSGCGNLLSVIIPDSVTYIGWDAFWNCAGLKSITIPDSVRTIGGFAFSNCTSLITVKFGENVSSIGSFAFSNCTSLETIYLSESIEKIGNSVFYGCDRMKNIFYPLDKINRAKITVLSDNRLSGYLWHYENSTEGLMPGDINDDGKVNNLDLVTLFQKLSGWEVKTREEMLDTNGDGMENNQDLICLFQFLSGWDVEVY